MEFKKIIASLFVAYASISCSHTQKEAFSKEALTEKIVSTDGNLITFQEVLNQHKGKVLVMEVWASWCGDCVNAMPKIKELQSNNPDVSYIFISLDKTAIKWKEGIQKHQLTGDHYLAPDGMKGAFGKAINLDWIPRYIIIDKTGKIILNRAIETDFEKINTTLKSLK